MASIQLIRTCNQKQTRVKLPKENASLSLMSTSQENEDSSWGNRCPQVSLMLTERLLVVLQLPWLILSRIEPRQALHTNFSLPTNFLGDKFVCFSRHLGWLFTPKSPM